MHRRLHQKRCRRQERRNAFVVGGAHRLGVFIEAFEAERGHISQRLEVPIAVEVVAWPFGAISFGGIMFSKVPGIVTAVKLPGPE